MLIPQITLLPYVRNAGSGKEQARPVLARRLGCSVTKIRMGQNANGKPFLEDLPSVHISITHSRNLMAVYAGPHEAGIDLEYLKDRGTMEEIVRNFFSPAERKFFFAEPGFKTERFYAVWTEKEARLKKEGGTLSEGLFNPPDAALTGKHWRISAAAAVGPTGKITDQYLLCAVAPQSTLDQLTLIQTEGLPAVTCALFTPRALYSPLKNPF